MAAFCYSCGVASAPATKAPGLSPKTPIGRHRAKIIGSEFPDNANRPEVRLKFCYWIEGDHTGKEYSHTFKIILDDENMRMDGQSVQTYEARLES